MAVSTRFTGDAAGLLKEQEKVADGAQKIGDEYSKLSRETRQAARVAESALRRAETAEDKYERQVKQTRVALQRRKITLDQYNRSVDQLASEYREASQAADEAVGPGLSQNIASAVSNMAGLVSAATLVTQAFTEAADQAERIGEANKEAAPGLGELVQVSRSDQDFAQLTADARRIFSEGGARTLDEAAALRFSLRSAGRDQDVDTFTQIGQVNLSRDIPELVKSIQQLSTAFGDDETGDTRSIISKGLAASAEAQTTLNELLSASARAASAGSRAGFSDESVLAATTAIADPLGPDVAATRLNRFFISLDKEGIEAQSIPEALRKIRERIEAGESVFDVLGGRQEAAQAFDLLEKNLPKFSRTLESVTAANDGSELTTRLQRGFGDDSLAAAIRSRQSEARQTLSQEQLGNQALLREAQIRDIDRLETQLGDSAVPRAFNRNVRRGLSRFLDVEPVPFDNEVFLTRRQLQARGDTEGLKLLEKIVENGEKLIQLDRSIANGGNRVTVPQPEADNQ